MDKYAVGFCFSKKKKKKMNTAFEFDFLDLLSITFFLERFIVGKSLIFPHS